MSKKIVLKIRLPKLRRSRRTRKISQLVLAKKAKVSAYQVAVAELGRQIRCDVATRIASALGIKLQSLRG